MQISLNVPEGNIRHPRPGDVVKVLYTPRNNGNNTGAASAAAGRRPEGRPARADADPLGVRDERRSQPTGQNAVVVGIRWRTGAGRGAGRRPACGGGRQRAQGSITVARLDPGHEYDKGNPDGPDRHRVRQGLTGGHDHGRHAGRGLAAAGAAGRARPVRRRRGAAPARPARGPAVARGRADQPGRRGPARVPAGAGVRARAAARRRPRGDRRAVRRRAGQRPGRALGTGRRAARPGAGRGRDRRLRPALQRAARPRTCWPRPPRWCW